MSRKHFQYTWGCIHLVETEVLDEEKPDLGDMDVDEEIAEDVIDDANKEHGIDQ